MPIKQQALIAYHHLDTPLGYRFSMATFGARVKSLRKTLKLTQQRLSAISGIAQSTISEIENDAIPNPGAAIMDALRLALNTNQPWLLKGTGQPGPLDGAMGFDEVEALHLIRQLDESHRQTWLVTGRALLAHQMGPKAANDLYISTRPPPSTSKPTVPASEDNKADKSGQSESRRNGH